ncbi:hypothetical protein BVRB_022630, partial [Beta vulgaris subsp. vulgaris]
MALTCVDGHAEHFRSGHVSPLISYCLLEYLGKVEDVTPGSDLFKVMRKDVCKDLESKITALKELKSQCTNLKNALSQRAEAWSGGKE